MKRFALALLVALCCACASITPLGLAASPTLTAAQYRAQANAICGKLNRQTNAPVPSGTLAFKLAYLANITNSAFEALKRLRPPSQLSNLSGQVLAVIANLPPLLHSLLVRAQAGTLTTKALLAALKTPAVVAETKLENQLWTKLGVHVCTE